MQVPLPDGAALHVEELPGRGPPVVLLHGILRSSRSWAGVARRLADAGRRVLLVDDRGHGATPGPVASWGPEAVADDALALLRAVGPAHLVGHSRGGTAASWVAVREPALARSLAVVASPPEASEAFRAHVRPLPGEANAYLAAIPDDAVPAHALRKYAGPALVVEAEDDPLYSPTHTLFWRAYLPYASFERVPGAGRIPTGSSAPLSGGHDFFEDDPAWLAERLLRHFAEAERARA